MNTLSRLSTLLLDLHGQAEALSEAPLPERVFERLQRALPFDSAMWASGAATPQGPLFHSIHLQHQPLQLLLDYEPLKQHDILFRQCLESPGTSLRANARTDLPPLFGPYLSKYGLEQALCTMTIDPELSLVTGVSLYRSDAGRPFDDDEVELMQAVFPHLIDVERRELLLRLQRGQPQGSAWPSSLGACDDKGLLRQADPDFRRLLQHEWPQWRGPWLPAPLQDAAIEGDVDVAVGQASMARRTRNGQLWLVRIRRRRAEDDLPARLRQVAELAARGCSYKDIATALGIAPNTARNHLAHLYRRLGITSKAALMARLQGAQPPP